jgi:hypothetical protein
MGADGGIGNDLERSVPGLIEILGRFLAQVVSRRLPTAAARIRAQVRSRGICGGQSDTGVGFLRVVRFRLPIRIPQSSSPSIIRGWYNRPNSGRRTKWTQSHPHPHETETKKNPGVRGHLP